MSAVALVAGIVAIIGGIGAMIALLVRISYQTGQLVARFGDHVADADRVHADQEGRIRDLERGTRGGRGGRRGSHPGGAG